MRALMFIGKEDLSAVKPECISPQMDRQWARCTELEGSKFFFGATSFKYSPIASVSQTLTLLWCRQGTKIEGDKSSNSALLSGVSVGTLISSKSTPDILVINHPLSDQEE